MFEKGHKRMGGKTPGDGNKLTKAVRDRLLNYVADNFNTFAEDMCRLQNKPLERAKMYVEVCKLVVPKSRVPEEVEESATISQMIIDRMFHPQQQTPVVYASGRPS